MIYDDVYKRISSGLKEYLKLDTIDSIPNLDSIQFNKLEGLSWIGSMCVRFISLPSGNNTSNFKYIKTIRSIYPEIVSVICREKNLIKLGFGDNLIYSIFSAPYQQDLVSIFKLAYQINTLVILSNNILKKLNYPTLDVGIGLGCSEDYVIKFGDSNLVNDNLYWVGNAFNDSFSLSSLPNKHDIHPIVLSSLFYSNVIEHLNEDNEGYKGWIKKRYEDVSNQKEFYHCDIILDDYDTWVKGLKK